MGKSWKTAGKVEKAQQKGQIFTKLAREIAVAAKAGGPDPAANSRLRLAIDAAKKVSCPNDTIERAIKKGAGLLDDGKVIEEITYEGYGPHGVGVIVECQTDNKHRTAPDMRHAFKSHEGNMGEVGSVAWMFERVGHIVGTKDGTFDPDEEAIEAGANEVASDDEGGYEFYTNSDDLDAVRDALVKRGWKVTTAELSYKAKNITELNGDQKKDVEEFLNYLDDMDDTHRVHATI
ncbi:YebC/PmpR family DNA-binding transcriptional regulator [Bdellovibrio reynosensis]|uniref:Probable transcriptional regulatory protein MNR06_03640 n=1 Tax=Bdellovibrio reynosensis TaxID=2835041 RepID=A0ABY4CAQ3_9BACT|nr:YebC/PmpR family DNA-binding transcriptional regulator [Bdellovibrio reynosensis]UOF02046.1 YebC/PmpR family DNA-binding transcriptional regulator [Bdellovibrio reynosensis]